MEFLNKYKVIVLGVVLGGVAGYAYYFFIGCSSGNCAITSSPINSSVYGMVMGGLALDLFKKKQPKGDDNSSGEKKNEDQ